MKINHLHFKECYAILSNINAMTGNSSALPFLQRAAGWCEAAKRKHELAPEQPPESKKQVGTDGFSRDREKESMQDMN